MFLENGELSIKLIDFGLAFHWKNNMSEEIRKSDQAKKIVGTVNILACSLIIQHRKYWKETTTKNVMFGQQE